jgi:hypothetical protein
VRKLLVLVALMGLLSLPLLAQADYPKAEVFGGYQYLYSGGNLNGWDASVTGNFTRQFGLEGDFSGTYISANGASAGFYTFAGGPVFAFRNPSNITPFVHVLIGGAHLGVGVSGVSVGTTGFAIIPGGGVEVKVAPHIAIRGQGDWVGLEDSGNFGAKNVRIAVGVSFLF